MRQDAPTLKNRLTDHLSRDTLNRSYPDTRRPIADLRQAQAKLKEQEAFLQSIYDGVEQQIFAIDVLGEDEFRYAGWNEMTAQALGVSSAAGRGKTPAEVFGIVEGEIVAARYKSCLQADGTLRYGEFATIAGKPTWWLTTLKPLRDRRGKIVRLVGTKIDMSDYKRASEERDRFFQVSGALLCTAGFDGYFKQVNPAFTNSLGYTETELLETPFLEFVHPDDRAATLAQVSQLSEGQRIVKFENRYRCQDGSYRWLSWTSAPSPDRQLIYAVADDITDRKQLEAQLRQQASDLETTLNSLKQAQAKLVQSEKMSGVGQMVAGVAHEINNPISFIHGNLTHAEIYTKNLLRVVHLYQKQYPEPPQAIADELDFLDLEFLQDDMMEMLRSMRTGTERIREIVKSLRTFSRLHEANLKVADIHEGIEGALMILQSRLSAKPKRSAIEVIKTFGTLPPIACYSGQLNQVLMNIIGNAIDAIDASFATTIPTVKPKVSIFGSPPSNPQSSIPSRLGKIHIRTEVTDNKWVAIHIADNGVGMSEEVRQKIFDPFFTTKPVGQGKGLGLSISYQAIVQTHGGELTCTSVPGEGSEFTIKIPIDIEASES